MENRMIIRGKLEVGSRKGEVRSGKSEVGSPKSEVGRGKWEGKKAPKNFRLPPSNFPFVLLIGLWLLLLPVFGMTQSLEDLLEVTRNNNLELKALYQDYLAALEKAPQVSQRPDPEVGIGAFVSPVETRLGAQRARLSASQMFPWFGTLDAREEVAIANAKAIYERVASSELELFFRIKEAYFQLYELDKAQFFIRRNITLLEALRQLALSKVESGKVSSADVLRVDLKVQALEQEFLILQQNKNKPLADLNQVLNRPLATPVTVQDTLAFAILPFDKDTLRNYIKANHPMIRMFSLQQDAAQKALVLNALEGKPSFGIGIDYLLVDPRTDANPIHNGKDIFQISARVSIPLYRKKYDAIAREENLRIEALENRKSDLENLFLSMIEKAYTDYETASLRQDLYTRQMATTKAAIQMLQAGYSTAGQRFDELLQLEVDLVDYDLKTLKAIVQSHLAKASIERFIN